MPNSFYSNLIKVLAPALLKAIDAFIRSRKKKSDYEDVKWINRFILVLLDRLNIQLSMSDVVISCLEKGENVEQRLPDFDEANGSPIIV